MNYAKLSGKLALGMGALTLLLAVVAGATKAAWWPWLALPAGLALVLMVLTHRLPRGEDEPK